MSNESAQGLEEPDEADHLDDIEDGVGCTEIWEKLSERRVSGSEDDPTGDTTRAEVEPDEA